MLLRWRGLRPQASQSKSSRLLVKPSSSYFAPSSYRKLIDYLKLDFEVFIVYRHLLSHQNGRVPCQSTLGRLRSILRPRREKGLETSPTRPTVNISAEAVRKQADQIISNSVDLPFDTYSRQ